jgi:hypothetical protein
LGDAGQGKPESKKEIKLAMQATRLVSKMRDSGFWPLHSAKLLVHSGPRYLN